MYVVGVSACACALRARGCVCMCLCLSTGLSVCRCELHGRGRVRETGLGRAPQLKSSSGDGRGCRLVAGIGGMMTNGVQFTGDDSGCYCLCCCRRCRRYLLRGRDCAVSGSCRNKWPGPRRLWVSVSVLFYPGRGRLSRAGMAWEPGLGWAFSLVIRRREKMRFFLSAFTGVICQQWIAGGWRQVSREECPRWFLLVCRVVLNLSSQLP